MHSYVRALRLFSRDVRLYLFTPALIGFAYQGIYLLLFNLYLLRLGYGPEFIGLVAGISQLAFALFSLPAGAVGGRWGNRTTMIAGLSVASAALGALPLTEIITSALQVAWLLAMYVLAWLGIALYWVNASPFLMSVTGPSERTHVYSVQSALFPLFTFLGSLVGGFLPGLYASALRTNLEQPAPYRLSLWTGAALLALTIPPLLAISRQLDGETERRKIEVLGTRERNPALYRLIAIMAASVFLQAVGPTTVGTYANVYLDTELELSTAVIGTMSAISQLMGIPAALLTPLLVARWGERRTVVASATGAALSLLPIAFIPHWSAAALSILLGSATNAIRLPAIQVFAMLMVPSSGQSTMSGATAMAVGLSGTAVGLVGGQVIVSTGYSALFALAAGAMAGGALLFGACCRTPRGAVAPAPRSSD